MCLELFWTVCVDFAVRLEFVWMVCLGCWIRGVCVTLSRLCYKCAVWVCCYVRVSFAWYLNIVKFDLK